MEILEVIQPGPLTTVQDVGRYGYQQYGVPPSGALDNFAFRIGNLLAGNDESAASLEITLFGCRLRVLRETTVAVTGADLGAALNCNPFPTWQTVTAKSGDVLSFPRINSGCRAYLALTGGLDVPLVMGSAATCVRAGIGGLEGRPLRRGDILHAAAAALTERKLVIPKEYLPVYGSQLELRVRLGPQDDYFTGEGIKTFLHSDYAVSAQSDRMGYRLDGPPIKHKGKADIVSDGVPSGAVQVPGDGRPIVLLADRQTTGGYTKIATVISADIPKIAQAMPGNRVRFRQVSEDEASAALREYERTINDIRRQLRDTDL